MPITDKNSERNTTRITDDAALWQLFRQGNSQVFEEIYSRYVNLLANYGRRIIRDDDMVKDAIQDLFVDLWKNRERLGPTDSIQFYLVKAYRRNLVKKVKSARQHIYINSDFPDFELSPETVIINGEDDKELINKLHINLNALSSRQKEVIFLRFYCGMDYSTISEIMKIHSQSAYNIVYRVLKVLRDRMLHKISILLAVVFQSLS